MWRAAAAAMLVAAGLLSVGVSQGQDFTLGWSAVSAGGGQSSGGDFAESGFAMTSVARYHFTGGKACGNFYMLFGAFYMIAFLRMR